MPLNLSTFIKVLFAIFVISLSLTNAKADIFSYVPNTVTKYLDIYNTTLNIFVDSVKLLGTPRNVQVNHDGSLVFVTTVADGSTQSYLHIINTVTYKRTRADVKPLDGKSVRGLAISDDDKDLYIAHSDGVTRVSDPGSSNIFENLDLTYSGMSMILSDDNDYLFVIGTKGGSGNDGISVVELSTFTEVAFLDLGIDQGSNEIIFSKEHLKLFVANSNTDEVVPIQISNYDDPENFSLVAETARQFRLGSNPVDLILHNNGTELIVVLSFLEYSKDSQGSPTGTGGIEILKTNDIAAKNTDPLTKIILDAEQSTYIKDVIHPLAINIDNNNNIYILKQIWSDVAGLYVVVFKDSTDFNGERTIKKQYSYNIGGKASTSANGQFIGPDCKDCPNGYESVFDPTERPAAINPFFLLLISTLLILVRRHFVKR